MNDNHDQIPNNNTHVEQLTLDLVCVQDIRTVAVLLAHGFHEHTRERGDRPGHVAFKLMVPKSRREEFDGLMRRCQRGYDIPLPGGVAENGTRYPVLGDYERAHARVRDAIREFNEFAAQRDAQRDAQRETAKETADGKDQSADKQSERVASE